MTRSPLVQIAEFVAGLRPEAVPKEVLRQARLCLLDTLGCMISAAGTDEAQRLWRAESAANPGAICSVAGGGRHSLLGAARINAYQGDVFELNDLIAGHASIGNVAAALALAQAREASEQTFLMALVAGIEATARVYNAFYPFQKPLDEVGIVSVGPVSTIGAAAASARILGLDAERTAHAMAIAAGWANWCPAEVIFGDGGMAKPMLFGGLPASVGISAALAAKEGMTGPLNILNSDKGLFVTIARQWDPSAITPEDWALNSPRRKLHACCGYIHSAYDTVEILVSAHGLTPEDIAAVRVEVPAYTIPAIWKAAPPSTPNEARFHMQYMLAHALAGAGPVTPAMSNDFTTHFARPEIRGLIDRITISAAAGLTHYHQSRVTIERSNGESLSMSNDAPRGTARNPLGEAALMGKFTDLAMPVLGPERTAQLAGLCISLGQDRTVAHLCRMIEAPAG